MAPASEISLAWVASRCLLPAPWNIDCPDCREACPEAALHVTDGEHGRQLHVSDACTNCHECLAACDTEALTAAPTKLSRRQLFRRAVNRPRAFDPADALPAPRKRWRMEAAHDGLESTQTRRHPRVVIDAARCDASGLCSRLCPTAALEEDASGVLRFDSHFCLGCGQCQAVCPGGAIAIQAEQAPKEAVLRRAELRECSHCGRSYREVSGGAASDEDWTRLPSCPSCRRDQALMKNDVMSLLR